MLSLYRSLHNIAINFYADYLHGVIPTPVVHLVLGILFFMIISIIAYWLLNRWAASSNFVNWVLNVVDEIKCFYHNYSTFIGDLLSTGIIFYLAHSVATSNDQGWLFAGVVLLSLAKACWRTAKVQQGIGKNFEAIYESKFKISKTYSTYNCARPPVWDARAFNPGAAINLITETLEHQLEMIKTLYRPGFSIGGEDRYSVSILFYDPRTMQWDLFDTIALPGDSRKSSRWPIDKSDFIFDNDLYIKKTDRIYNIAEVQRPEYESILQVPLYFRETYSPGLMEFDEVYCIVSFASKKKKSFQKLKSVTSPVRKFFLPEIYILEKYIFKLYRFHVKI